MNANWTASGIPSQSYLRASSVYSGLRSNTSGLSSAYILPAGTIAGGLPEGDYIVNITVTSLAGNTSTDTKTLTVVMEPKPVPEAGDGLAATGISLYVIATVGVVGVMGGVAYLRRRFLS